MANDIDKTSPHYKGEFGSIYEVNQKFPSGGVEGDYVAIDGWAHYWNADRETWCVNAQRDSYWDELITGIIEKFKLFKGATYMGVAGLDTVPAKAIGAKMYYFATVAGTYKNFGGLVVPQGINVLYSENGNSWVCSTLLEVAQELGLSTRNVVSQKVVKDALDLKANQSSVNEALEKKADKETVDTALGKKADKETVDVELGKKFDKESIAQEPGEAEDKVMSQKIVSAKLSDLQVKTHYINGLDCAKELYIFNNEVGIKDLHLAYRNHKNTWYLVFFNDSKSVAQTDVYKEEIGGIIPIYKLENRSLAEVIGYIDVDWSALKEGATAIVKELLPPAFDMYSNPNISNLIQDYDSSYVAKNLLAPDSFSQVTQFATWNLDADIWKLVSYKAPGNALYKSFERDTPLLKSGHIFYFCENMKSNAECMFIAQIDSTNNSVCIHSGSGEYEFMSNVLKINFSGGGNNLLVVAARLMESASVEVKDFIMIDLTDIFGKDNEPSREYMDFLFKRRMSVFYGEKKLFTSENFAIKELCDKVNDLTVSGNNMAQGRITGDMFKKENKNILINALNESIGDFVKINKTNDVCVRYVKLDDDTHEIYSKINYSLRKKILFDGLSDDAKANAINARSIERIYRFADAKCLSDLDRDFSVKSNIDGGEPSAIVSKDGSTLYLYSYLKRYSSYDGFVWSEPEYLKCGGVKMADRGNEHYMMHCNVNLIDGVYYLTGCRQNLGGELLLYTSKDGINFEYVGIALEANHKVGDYSAKNWGNTYMIKDYGTGYYYLYFEFEDDNIHWNTAVVRSLNPLDGSWKNCKEDVIIKPAYQSSHANSSMFGCGNVDFVKGMDNQPIKFNGRFYMYYHGTCYERNKHFNQSNIMRAYSYNLIDWFDEGVILDVRKKPSDIISSDGEKTDGDNTSGNADHCVIEFKGKSYMFYTYDINHAEGMERIYTVIDSRRFIELLKFFP